MPTEDKQFDVALSFAGEQREYVEKCAKILKTKGARVFYDRFEEIRLWGEDLLSTLDSIYRAQSEYVVIFVSASYRDSVWTVHELRSALSAVIAEKRTRVLPARFDDTELPGLQPSIAYIPLHGISPESLAEKIYAKVRSRYVAERTSSSLGFQASRPNPLPSHFEPYCRVGFEIGSIEHILEEHYSQFGHVKIKDEAEFEDEGILTVQIYARQGSLLPLREISMYDWADALLAEDAALLFGKGSFVYHCCFYGRPEFLYERSEVDVLSFTMDDCRAAFESIRLIQIEFDDGNPDWSGYDAFRLLVFRSLMLGEVNYLQGLIRQYSGELAKELVKAVAHTCAQGAGEVDATLYDFPSGLQAIYDSFFKRRGIVVPFSLEEKISILAKLSEVRGDDRSVAGAMRILKEWLSESKSVPNTIAAQDG